MKPKQISEEWTYEFNSLSTFSPNGQFTVKSGDVGTPICVLPMPIGGINTMEKQEDIAKLITAAPMMLKAIKTNYLMLLSYMPDNLRNTITGQQFLSNALTDVVNATGKNRQDIQDSFEHLSVSVKYNKMTFIDALKQTLEL